METITCQVNFSMPILSSVQNFKKYKLNERQNKLHNIAGIKLEMVDGLKRRQIRDFKTLITVGNCLYLTKCYYSKLNIKIYILPRWRQSKGKLPISYKSLIFEEFLKRFLIFI